MTDLLQIVIALAPPPAVVAVAGYLVSVAGDAGCFPKQATIAKKTGFAVRTVAWAVKWLKDRKILATELRGPTSALYLSPSTVVEKPCENPQLSLDFGAPLQSSLQSFLPITYSEPLFLGTVFVTGTESSAKSQRAAEGTEPAAVSDNSDNRESRVEPQEATRELREILATFPARFSLTREAIAVLAARLIRKAAYWKRPVADVEAYLERKSHSIRQQPWLRPWSTAWFTTDLEGRFHLDDVDARAKPPPTASPPPKPVEYERNEEVVSHFACAIADLARSKCMPTGRIV